MTRTRLPNRRPCESMDIEHAGQKFTLSVGELEVFINAHKPDSMMAVIASEVGLLISQGLRHGIPLARLQHSMPRTENGDAAGLSGAVLDAMCGVVE